MDKHLDIRSDATTALHLASQAFQRANLLFTLIEAAIDRGDVNQATLLAQIGAETTASAGDIADTDLKNISEAV
jgi:hypothetical protein